MEEKKIQDRPRGPGEGIWTAPVGHVAHLGVSFILGVPQKHSSYWLLAMAKPMVWGLGYPFLRKHGFFFWQEKVI